MIFKLVIDNCADYDKIVWCVDEIGGEIERWRVRWYTVRLT